MIKAQSKLKAVAKEVLFLAAIGLAAWLVIGWIQKEGQKGGGGNLPVGSPAPGFALTWVTGAGTDAAESDRDFRKDSRGQRVSLASRQGKPLILNFWATWCHNCVKELPAIAGAVAEADGRYSVLTVSNESPSKVRAFLAERGYDIPVLYDPGGRISDSYKVESIPTTVIIDAQGNVVHDFVGAAHGDVLRDHMEALIVD